VAAAHAQETKPATLYTTNPKNPLGSR